MKEPRGKELVTRYKKQYRIPMHDNVSEEMILAHWELERRLTKDLVESLPINRWEIFERCYSNLYTELEWLNRLLDSDNIPPPYQRFRNIRELLDRPPKKIYEIGSGKGEMISYLCSQGFECKATEITRERGQKYAASDNLLSWGHSDGVHLDEFETSNSYDIVISNQVVEHLHPDDLLTHFKAVLSILVVGGRYIFTTPHKYIGPSDISRVFKYDIPCGMHLKEYTYRELKEFLVKAGYQYIYAVLCIPDSRKILVQIRKLFGPLAKPRASLTYLTYLMYIEKILSFVPCHAIRRKLTGMSILFMFAPNMFIVAEKSK